MTDMTNPGVVFAAPNDVRMEDLTTPQPGPGELLIETSRSLISVGTELTMLSGDFLPGSRWANSTTFPCHPGYANVGRVAGVGEGADPDWVTKRVASYSPHARQTTMASSFCWPVPDDIDSDQAAFFVIAQITMNAVRRSQLTWGESVVVFGMGLLGQLTARLCVLAGAARVFVVDISDRRLELAGEGVIPINPTKQDVGEVVSEHNAGRLADVVFEVTGNADLIASEMQVLRPVGRFVIVSSPKRPVNFDFHDLCNNPSFSIIGAHNFSHPEAATSLNPWTQNVYENRRLCR